MFNNIGSESDIGMGGPEGGREGKREGRCGVEDCVLILYLDLDGDSLRGHVLMNFFTFYSLTYYNFSTLWCALAER